MAAVEEWDAGSPPPENVRRRRSAGRQFESVPLEGQVQQNAALSQTSTAHRQQALGSQPHPSSWAPPPEEPAKKMPKEGTKAHANLMARQAKQAAEEKQYGEETEAAVKGRKDWEASPAGQERMKDVVDYATEQHNKLARERPELGLKVQDRLKLTHAQAYAHYGFGEHHERGRPTEYDRQLPGMEDPQALDRPKRWEEYSPEEQATTLEEVRHEAGVGPEEMEKSFGAQLDQGYLRARQVEGPENDHSTQKRTRREGEQSPDPYAQTFYHHGEAAQQLKQTSLRHGVSMGLTAAVNADTSPQMLFRSEVKGQGVRYPNAERADHIIKHIVAGKHPDDWSMGEPGEPGALESYARTGLGVNTTKALERAQKVVHGGQSIRETFAGTSGGTGFGPKTGAYHNAWLAGTPQFFVSDIHSGGGGMLPHQGTEKPEKGKSEREKTIEFTSRQAKTIPRAGFHALADYAARQAMKKRGLTHVEQAQAVQWGEEQIQRQESGSKGHFPSEEQAYRPEVKNPRQFEYEPGKFEEAPKVRRKRGGQPKPKPPPEQGSLF